MRILQTVDEETNGILPTNDLISGEFCKYSKSKN